MTLLVIPPRFSAEGSEVGFKSPSRAVLLRNMVVSFCDFRWIHQSVRAQHVAVLSKALGSQQFTQGIRRINRSVHDDVRDVNTPGSKLGIERLTEQTPPPDRSCMGVLSRVASRRRCR